MTLCRISCTHTWHMLTCHICFASRHSATVASSQGVVGTSNRRSHAWLLLASDQQRFCVSPIRAAWQHFLRKVQVWDCSDVTKHVK